MIISFFHSLRRKFQLKSFKLTVFEIALYGLLLGIYFGCSLLERYVFKGPFKITLTYVVFIIFGLALGPLKGAFLGILCDTLDQVIYGISTWMVEYAIVPAVIAILSGLMMMFIFSTKKRTWPIGFIILSIITTIMVVFLLKYNQPFDWSEYRFKSKEPISKLVVGLVSGFGLGIVWIMSFCFFLVNKFNKNFEIRFKMQNLFGILIGTFLIIVIVRWFWGPFAYINYHNRFRNGTWSYQTYFLPFMIPIMFKSFLEVPVYATVIFAFKPVISLIVDKINFYTQKIFVY
ncbi:hypothetical protein [[Mycoplasma] anseris]|uniref:ECF transporter S component n=1 Tax=[Mycoplasma] anseris TaxID=92400 RepID=A0A2Z4NCW2_9BACT|nr:hypothetical protein [[Mycoplasma] anseris]AWX69326.1 ECF transporter S component [[Mycoplasma] anseris]